MARTSRGCILVKSATWSNVRAVLSTNHTAVAFGISGALLMAYLLCASPTSAEAKLVVIGDDGNYATYISLQGGMAQWASKIALTEPKSSPKSLLKQAVPRPPARGDSVPR